MTASEADRSGLPAAASSPAEADYRFGWRWLIPLEGVASLSAVGLSGSDERFLLDALRLAPAAGLDRSPDRLLVVAADQASPHALDAPSRSAAQVACVFGTRRAVRAWRSALGGEFRVARSYGLLPAHGARVVVPLDDARSAARGLALHTPGRFMARVAVALARSLLPLGITTPLREQTLLIATRGRDLTPWGARSCALGENLPGDGFEYALYLGRPDEGRKTVILVLQDSQPVSLVKVAETGPAKALLRREVLALRALEATTIAGMVPKCRSVHDGDPLAVFEEYRPREGASPSAVRRSAVRFLAELSTLERASCALGDELDGLTGVDRLTASGARLLGSLKRQARGGRRVWKHRVHGDFAPWNCAWTRDGLFVYDWEYSIRDGYAFSDAFYFALAPAVLVGSRSSPAALVRAGLALAADVGAHAKFPPTDLVVQLALWALRLDVERSTMARSPWLAAIASLLP